MKNKEENNSSLFVIKGHNIERAAIVLSTTSFLFMMSIYGGLSEKVPLFWDKYGNVIVYIDKKFFLLVSIIPLLIMYMYMLKAHKRKNDKYRFFKITYLVYFMLAANFVMFSYYFSFLKIILSPYFILVEAIAFFLIFFALFNNSIIKGLSDENLKFKYRKYTIGALILAILMQVYLYITIYDYQVYLLTFLTVIVLIILNKLIKVKNESG